MSQAGCGLVAPRVYSPMSQPGCSHPCHRLGVGWWPPGFTHPCPSLGVLTHVTGWPWVVAPRVFSPMSQAGCGVVAPRVLTPTFQARHWGAGCSRPLCVSFLPRAGQWMETGTSGRAGAPAPPAAPRADSSARVNATGLPTGVRSARATGWRPETASCSSAQVRGAPGWGRGAPNKQEPLGRGQAPQRVGVTMGPGM